MGFNPETVTKDQLEHMGLDENKVEEILQLKDILNRVESDQPIDNQKLAHDLEEVMDEIKSDAEHLKEEQEASNSSDIYQEKRLDDAEDLKIKMSTIKGD